jgi:hypothetical protein
MEVSARIIVMNLREIVRSHSLGKVIETINEIKNNPLRQFSNALLDEMLIHATRCNRTEVVEVLLRFPMCNPDAMDGMPMVWAVLHKNERVVRALLAKTKILNWKDSFAFTIASRTQQSRIMTLMTSGSQDNIEIIKNHHSLHRLIYNNYSTSGIVKHSGASVITSGFKKTRFS